MTSTMTCELFAQALAHGDEQDQAAFLNAFVEELIAVCPQHDASGQLWHVCKGLKSSTVDVLKSMCESYAYQRAHTETELCELHVELDTLRKQKERLTCA